MRTIIWQYLLGFCAFLAWTTDCEASKWKALREGLETLTKKSGKVLREGADAEAKRSASRRALFESLESGAGTAGSRVGRTVVREAGTEGGALAVRVGTHVARPVISKFGDDGARALASLSPEGAKRLASMADDLAASGRGTDWMKLIAERGDGVMEWLWKRKGSVAVGTVAAAIAVQPEEFLRASQNIATSTVKAAGEHVVQPLITEGTKHIAAPIAQSAAAAFPWRNVWAGAVICLVAWWLKEQLSSTVGLTLVKFLDALKGRRKSAERENEPNPANPS